MLVLIAGIAVKPGPVKPEPVVVTPLPAMPPSMPPSMPPERNERNERSWMTWTGIAAGGVGVIGLGLAIDDAGNAAHQKAYITASIGGALVIGGVVLFVLSRGGERRDAPQMSLAPTRGGAAATYSLAL